MSAPAPRSARGAVVPIVLAAGASTRMGSPKAAAHLGERTLLRHVLDACAAGGLARAIVVAGAHPGAVRAAATGATIEPVAVENPLWERGRATSIRRGLEALDARASAFLLWPVDVPLGDAALPRLLEARERGAPRGAGGPCGWVPVFGARRGHPLLLDRSVAAELFALADDASAREVVRALAARGVLAHVPAPDAGVLLDANAPADLAILERLLLERARIDGNPPGTGRGEQRW